MHPARAKVAEQLEHQPECSTASDEPAHGVPRDRRERTPRAPGLGGATSARAATRWRCFRARQAARCRVGRRASAASADRTQRSGFGIALTWILSSITLRSGPGHGSRPAPARVAPRRGHEHRAPAQLLKGDRIGLAGRRTTGRATWGRLPRWRDLKPAHRVRPAGRGGRGPLGSDKGDSVNCGGRRRPARSWLATRRRLSCPGRPPRPASGAGESSVDRVAGILAGYRRTAGERGPGQVARGRGPDRRPRYLPAAPSPTPVALRARPPRRRDRGVPLSLAGMRQSGGQRPCAGPTSTTGPLATGFRRRLPPDRWIPPAFPRVPTRFVQNYTVRSSAGRVGELDAEQPIVPPFPDATAAGAVC